jgi:cytochrome c553
MHHRMGSVRRRRQSGRAPPMLASFVLAVGLIGLVSPPASAQAATGLRHQDETPEQYPAGPNRAEAFYFCTACHGFRIVAAQGMSRARWDESLTWMTERHNMPKLEGEEREKILDYLATAFPERQRSPGGWRTPFAPQ